ncbi:MAG: DUF1211 domain-containing protein [Ignavibacteriaceae bacterium]|nr:DUF1211 domain-containing protein [Ignavibacteriaceae bacterium]
MSANLMEKNRLEAFSDGVLAIIITLLVLEIKVPEVHGDVNAVSLYHALLSILPKFLSWALSFFMVLIMWVNHHRIFSELKSVNNQLLWLNGILLFFISFITFPTAFLGDYFNQQFTMMFFGIWMSLTAFTFSMLRLYIYKNQWLLREGIKPEDYKSLLTRSLLFGPPFYLLGAFSTFIHVYLGYAMYAMVPLYFVFFGSKKSKE